MTTSLLISALLLAAPPVDLDAPWHDACLWEVGSNLDKVKAARAELIAGGERTLAFLIPDKLDTADTLVTRALNQVLVSIGDAAVPRLLPCLESDRPSVRRNAADLLGGLGATAAAPAIARLLADPDARLGALAALTALAAPAAVPPVVALAESDAPERVRYTAIATLGAIGGAEAEAALVRALCQGPAPVRFAAQFALEKQKAVGALRAALADPEPVVRLHALAALGHLADPAARPSLLGFLDDASPIVRGFAAEALGAMLDRPLRLVLEDRLETEDDPFARSKLRQALGR